MSGHHPGRDDLILDAPKEPAGTFAQNSLTAYVSDCVPGVKNSSCGVFSVLETTQPQSCHNERDQKESDVKITTVTETVREPNQWSCSGISSRHSYCDQYQGVQSYGCTAVRNKHLTLAGSFENHLKGNKEGVI